MHRTEWRPWSAFRNATAKRATVSKDVEAFGPAGPATPPARTNTRRGAATRPHMADEVIGGSSSRPPRRCRCRAAGRRRLGPTAAASTMHRTEWRPWSAFRNATAKRATVSQDVEAFGPAVPRTPPAWKIERRGPEAELHLTGDWIAGETGVRDAAAVDEVLVETGDAARLHLDRKSTRLNSSP